MGVTKCWVHYIHDAQEKSLKQLPSWDRQSRTRIDHSFPMFWFGFRWPSADLSKLASLLSNISPIWHRNVYLSIFIETIQCESSFSPTEPKSGEFWWPGMCVCALNVCVKSIRLEVQSSHSFHDLAFNSVSLGFLSSEVDCSLSGLFSPTCPVESDNQ